MADVIEVEYRAGVDGFKAQLKDAELSLKKVETTGKQSAEATTKHFQSSAASIKEAAGQIAVELGLAFGVSKIIEFGKESVKAFVEAEQNANKLKFAVTKIGNEGESAFRKLIEQSSKLQKVSIFSDDSIQQAQTQLLTLGLTSKQVESLIPKVLDLASATGQDLSSATQSIIQGINGQTRSLKAVGLSFDATSDKTKNLSLLTEKLTKFNGASADALETVAGKAKRLENAIDDIKESVGEFIVNQGNDFLDFFEGLNKGFDSVINRRASGVLADQFAKQNDSILAKAKASEAERARLVFESTKEILRLTKERNDQVLDEDGINFVDRSNQQKKAFDLAIKNQVELSKELRNLNKDSAGSLGGAPVDQAAIDKKNADLKKQHEEDVKRQQDENSRLSKIFEADQKEREKTILEIEKEKNEALNKEGSDQAKKDSDFAKFNADEIAKIKKEGEAKVTADKKQAEADRKTIEQAGFAFVTTALASIQQIHQNGFQEQINGVNETKDAETSALDEQLKKKVITQEQYDKKKADLDLKAHKQEAVLKRQAFESAKQAQIIATIMNTAGAIIAQINNPTPYVGFALAALAAATGAVQLAVIESQPTPKFAKGVVDLKGKGTGTSDDIHAMISSGESIVTSNATSMHKGLLQAMNQNKGNKYIEDVYVAPILKAQLRKNAELKDNSFASNIANSLALNSNFKDSNLLDSLKQSRKAERENFIFLAKTLSNNKNKRNW